eukprot:SAG25_NODE_1102_length_3977_cov_2.741877_2_plen_245_part_00
MLLIPPTTVTCPCADATSTCHARGVGSCGTVMAGATAQRIVARLSTSTALTGVSMRVDCDCAAPPTASGRGSAASAARVQRRNARHTPPIWCSCTTESCPNTASALEPPRSTRPSMRSRLLQPVFRASLAVASRAEPSSCVAWTFASSTAARTERVVLLTRAICRRAACSCFSTTTAVSANICPPVKSAAGGSEAPPPALPDSRRRLEATLLTSFRERCTSSFASATLASNAVIAPDTRCAWAS